MIHHLVANETIDEDIIIVLANKKAGQKALLDAVKVRTQNVYQEVS